MVKPITTYVAQKRLSWYGHVMRRDEMNVAKHVTTMKVGGKRPRGRPRLRWMDRVRSDLKQHKPRTEKDGERQSWRSTPDRDKIGKGTQRYAKVRSSQANATEA